MEYKKVVIDGYVIGIGLVQAGGNIAEQEYLSLQTILRNKPVADEGCIYKLKDITCEWEMVEKPVEEEATEQDYIESLERLGVEI